MSSLVTEKRKGRKKGSKGKCSYCWNVMGGVLDMDHNIRTCPRRKKHEAEQEEMNRKKAPRDTTPHYDEDYSNAPTPSRSNRFSLRRSPRIVAEASNAPPSQTRVEKVLASLSKMSIKQSQNNDNDIWKSYGTCSLCLEPMFRGSISTLLCGHNLHTNCIPDLIERGDDKCPECREEEAVTGLIRAEPPKDELQVLKSDNAQHQQKIYMLKKQLEKAEKQLEKAKVWERDARFLWREFVTPEIASSNFIWRNMSKRYLVK